MKGIRGLLAALMVAAMCGSAWGEAPDGCSACTGIKTQMLEQDAAVQLMTDGGLKDVNFRVRRQVRAVASDGAYARMEGALGALAKARGLAVAEQASNAAAVVEVDTWFFVYTNKFNAKRVWLSEYTQVQLTGATGGQTEATPAKVDVLRVAAGALGIVKGWISPAYGSYMMASGSRDALFGAGAAPYHGLLPDRDRYERGEQEVTSNVRITVAGRSATFKVKTTMDGDAPPFSVDALVAENWAAIVAVLGGQAPSATVSLAGRETR